MGDAYDYDVCLSFAGEEREYIEQVADGLRTQGIRTFYDGFEQATLWGKDLYTHLDDIYRKKAKYCVLFISAAYAQKVWPNHERSSAQARAFIQNEEYILPARFDDTELPGVRPTVGYVDLRITPPATLVQLIAAKLAASPDIAIRPAHDAQSPLQPTGTDSAKDLFNRTAGRHYLEFELPREVEKRRAHTFTVALLDVDELTLINKRFGTTVGDRVLSRVESLMRKSIPHEHPAGRCGDDTFFAIFLFLAEAKAQAQCRSLVRRLAGVGWKRVAAQLRVTCSLGMATRHPGEPVLDGIIRAAIGMVEAKEHKNIARIAPHFLPVDQSRDLSRYFS